MDRQDKKEGRRVMADHSFRRRQDEDPSFLSPSAPYVWRRCLLSSLCCCGWAAPPFSRAGRSPHFPEAAAGGWESVVFPKRHLWAAFGGPCRMRGRSAPRTPRVTLSMEKESPESQPRGHPPWQSPWVTLLLLGKRSRSARPCPTGTTPHQARNCPSRRQPPKSDSCRGP